MLALKRDLKDRPLPTERVELVGIDLDGTMLREDNSVSVEVAQAIHEATAAGIKVVIVTARPWRGSYHIHEALGLETLMVNHNGAVIHDPVGRQLHRHLTVPGEVAKQVVQLARHIQPNIGLGVEVLDRFYIDRKANKLKAVPELAMSDEKPNPFDKLYESDITKVCLVGEPGHLGDIQLQLTQRARGKLGIAYSNVRLLQVVHHEATKGNALAFVAEHYGIPRERVMAIGDAPNDTPMLKWAGLGIAMANAWPDARHAAQFVVASNEEDGVAEAIRRFALI